MARKHRYKLPKYPVDSVRTFQRLCEAIPAEHVDSLREELDSFLEKLAHLRHDNPACNIDVARRVADRGHILLDRYGELPKEKQALVIGALRYFVLEEDCLDDTLFASGFDDDAQVMNYVLQEVGIEDKFIHLD